MAKRGRKDKYSSYILPRFKDIDKWLNEGASEKNIAHKLGIAYSTWNTYKQRYNEFYKLVNKPREGLISDLRSALIKKALGFEYEEKKQYIKEDKESHKKYVYTEITKKVALPDTTAIFGALNLYDPDYVKDRKQHELREQELELKKMAIENKEEW